MKRIYCRICHINCILSCGALIKIVLSNQNWLKILYAKNVTKLTSFSSHRVLVDVEYSRSTHNLVSFMLNFQFHFNDNNNNIIKSNIAIAIAIAILQICANSLFRISLQLFSLYIFFLTSFPSSYLCIFFFFSFQFVVFVLRLRIL